MAIAEMAISGGNLQKYLPAGTTCKNDHYYKPFI